MLQSVFFFIKIPSICTINTFISWGRGRLLIAFLFFLSARVGYAQTGCTPFIFEICSKSPGPPWDGSFQGSNSPGTFHIYYDVKIKMQSGDVLPLDYAVGYLAFSGKISVNGFTSRINKSLTDQLSAQFAGVVNPFFQYLSYDEETGEVTWVVGNAVTGCNEGGGAGTPLHFHDLTGNVAPEVWLFTIAVDAAPGDIIKWETGPTVDVQTCASPGCIGTIPLTGCGIQQAPFQIDMPAPPACNPARTVNFALQLEPQGLYNLVVTISGLPVQQLVQKIDGVIHIEPNMNSVSEIDFEKNPFQFGNAGSDVWKRKNSDGSFDIYFIIHPWIPMNSTENILALRILGQYNLSQGGALICSLTTGRGVFASPYSCTLQSVPATLTIPGYTLCDNKFKVHATGTAGPDCQLNVQYTLSFMGPSTLSLAELRLKFYFMLANDNNSPGTISTTLPCSGCGTLTQSPNNPLIWIYDYYYNQTQQGAPLILNNGTTVTVPFMLNQDCIQYFVYTAEAISVGSAGYCALNVEIDQSQWPACNPVLHGRVTIGDLSDTPAPYYRVSLKSTIDPNYVLIAEGNGSCPYEYSMCPDPTKAPFQLVATAEPGAGSQHCGCGVTTLDLALISRHILGIQPLPFSPYSYIAADANTTPPLPPNPLPTTISTSDIVEIRRCLLGLQSNFGQNNSSPPWRYFQSDYVFNNTNEPFNQYPYTGADISSVPSSGYGDYGVFYGVKIGDVNFSCNCYSNRPNSEYYKDEVEAKMTIGPTRLYQRDRLFSVPITLNTSFPLLAAQAGLRFDASTLHLTKIIPNTKSGVNARHISATQIDDGEIRFVWYQEDGISMLHDGDLLFTLEFELEKDTLLPQEPWLWTSDAILPSIVYNASGDQLEIPWRLVWADTKPGSTPIGLALSPNPFQENASAFIDMPAAGNALMQIQDTKGKIWATQYLDLPTGENQVQIQTSDIPPGVYMLSVDAMGQRVTRRIVKL